MNVLLIYRTKVILTEILQSINKYKNYQITLVADRKIKALKYSLNIKGIDIKVISVQEFLEGKLDNMKFDYTIGNPPYQYQVGENGKTRTIWDEIVLKCYNLLKQNGTMSMIHPGGWRFSNNGSNNNLFKVKELYQNNKIISMEFHDLKDGYEKFGASTDYDIITLRKEPNFGITNICTKTDGNIEINIKDYDKIPTDNFKMFNILKAKKNEPRVELIFDSNYHTSNGGEKCVVRNIKDKVFKYPVIYGMPENGIKYFYSITKNKGHFGIPKLILAKAGSTTILDLEGKYGMTQFAAGVVDKPENLVKMQKAIESAEFRRLKSDFTGIGQSINKNAIIDAPGNMLKFIREFRKDFWKEFYTPEMEQELIKEGRLDENGNCIL